MNQRSARLVATAAMMLAALAIIPAAAGPVIWFATDIGAPSARGSTHVDASGAWTIKGGGDPTVWGSADNFQYAYQRVAGDVSITGRFLTMDGGHPEWAMAGLMIRENDSTGSRNVFFCMTSLHGLHAFVAFRCHRSGAGDKPAALGGCCRFRREAGGHAVLVQ